MDTEGGLNKNNANSGRLVYTALHHYFTTSPTTSPMILRKGYSGECLPLLLGYISLGQGSEANRGGT